MTELLYKDEAFAIIGAMMEVHSVLGPGFLEQVYQEAAEIECGLRQIPYEPQKELLITYKGRRLRKTYVADLVCFGKIIVELKALDRLTSREDAQLLNDLKATGHELGLLVNFGAVGKLEWKRLARTRN